MDATAMLCGNSVATWICVYGYGYIHGYPQKVCGYGYGHGYGWEISYPRQPWTDFDAVHSWIVCGSHKSRKKSLKTPILEFKVIQGHWCWYPQKARQQCLLWCAASLCLSATVLLLDWTTVADRGKIMISKGVPLFDALVQGEFPHPVAPNCLIRNQRL